MSQEGNLCAYASLGKFKPASYDARLPTGTCAETVLAVLLSANEK